MDQPQPHNYEIYQKKTKDLNAFDFGDLILFCVKLFEEHEDIREIYQNNFSSNDLYQALLGITPSGSLYNLPYTTTQYPVPSGSFLDYITKSNKFKYILLINSSKYSILSNM